MKIIVMNEDQITKYKIDEPHILISISSPDSRKPSIMHNSSCLETLYLVFHDLERPYPQMNARLISKSDAEAIWESINEYKDKIEVIICQCEAGISRSAGVAGAISKVLNGDDSYFFKKYLPNMLVYRTVLEEGRNDN
jgi:predicted protein tyrosine phosphatase